MSVFSDCLLTLQLWLNLIISAQKDKCLALNGLSSLLDSDQIYLSIFSIMVILM